MTPTQITATQAMVLGFIQDIERTDNDRDILSPSQRRIMDVSINALRAALAEPVGEPVKLCCEENRKEISTLNDRVMWLMNEVNTINNTLTANFTEICALEQRIAYLELPWWKKLWK